MSNPTSLSERVRPNIEAAPWVCEALKELEARLAEVTNALERGKVYQGSLRQELKDMTEERDRFQQALHAEQDRVDVAEVLLQALDRWYTDTHGPTWPDELRNRLAGGP